jgi:hypothetical protein
MAKGASSKDSGSKGGSSKGGMTSNGSGGSYTGLRDMFDGGGPGQSGKQFQGAGVISDIGNALGGPGTVGFGPSGGEDTLRANPSSQGILGTALDPRITPERLAGSVMGNVAFGPVGGILGSLIGQQIAAQRLSQAQGAPAKTAPLMNKVELGTASFANGGDVRPGFFGRLAGLGVEDGQSLFGGLGSLGDVFFGRDDANPDDGRMAALREALDAGEISQDTYESMYARLLMDEDTSDPAMGLLKLSEYITQAGQSRAPTQLSTTIDRGSGGSGARALGRLGAQPLA